MKYDRFRAGSDCILVTTVESYSSGTRVIVRSEDIGGGAVVCLRSNPDVEFIVLDDLLRSAKRVQSKGGDGYARRSKTADAE